MSFLPDNYNEIFGNEYYIKYPNHWNEVDIQVPNLKFVIRAPEYDFYGSANLVIEYLDPKENISLEEYKDISISQVSNQITNFSLINIELEQNRIINFYKLEYTGLQGKMDLRYIQYIGVALDTAIVLTFTFDEAGYNTSKSDIQDMVKSFKIK